ncbi:ABC transporter ATP-binding protein [Roseibium sp.]|uniref:ABC transporter ATP-binding protein n=1 Tax=Roseibium sp. TaxID=1936156 RepID=UPI003513FF2F
MTQEVLIDVKNLTMRFGGLTAIDSLNFEARNGEITALIGPNGAGKTTVFNCITGFYKPTEGGIFLHAPGGRRDLSQMTGHKINSEGGVARTFQNIRLFGRMTVLENLLVAQHMVLHADWKTVIGGLWSSRAYRQSEEDAIRIAGGWLERLGLSEWADHEAHSLPYGEQRRLEIARAMCTNPRLLCLDEPAAGLNAVESAALAVLLNEICSDDGIGIILIEHDMSVVMDISHHVVVLDYGRKIAEGPPEKVKEDSHVIKAYLGADEDEELIPEIAEDLGVSGL